MPTYSPCFQINNQKEEISKFKTKQQSEKSLKQDCIEKFQKHITELTKDITDLMKKIKFHESYTDSLKAQLVNNKKLLIIHLTKYNQIVDEYNLIQEEYK